MVAGRQKQKRTGSTAEANPRGRAIDDAIKWRRGSLALRPAIFALSPCSCCFCSLCPLAPHTECVNTTRSLYCSSRHQRRRSGRSADACLVCRRRARFSARAQPCRMRRPRCVSPRVSTVPSSSAWRELIASTKRTHGWLNATCLPALPSVASRRHRKRWCELHFVSRTRRCATQRAT